MTETFALVGHSITHTISPFIHNRLFSQSNIDAKYKVLDITPDRIKDVYSFTLKNLSGYNITIPYKVDFTHYVDNLDISAKRCGSINTVKNSNNISTGFNTDGIGFLKSVENSKIKLEGHVVVLGAGGAARAISYECAKFCSCLTIAVRESSLKRAHSIINDLKSSKVFCKKFNVILIDDLNFPTDVLINTTPVGMFPNQNDIPVKENALKNCKFVFDAVYNPFETVFLKKAKANGAIVLGGLSMLVWQAVFAHKIWNNTTFKLESILELIEDAKNEIKRNFYV